MMYFCSLKKRIKDEKDEEEYNLFNYCGNTRFGFDIGGITKEKHTKVTR
jgi:hypothetical protein